MAVAANRFQLARTIDEERAQLRAPLQSDVIWKQQHSVYADSLRTAYPGQTLRFNLPADPGKFLDTINSYFQFDVQMLTSISGGTETVATQLTPTTTVVPINGVTSLIRFVRITSRGYTLEEIDNYGMLDSIFKEVTVPANETRSVGWIGGYSPRVPATKGVLATVAWPNTAQVTGATAGTPFCNNHVDMTRITNTKKMWAPVYVNGTPMPVTKCFRLDLAGLFKSNHYLPLEWMPLTIEIVFHNANACLRSDLWPAASLTVASSAVTAGAIASSTDLDALNVSKSFKITNPIFQAQLLSFNSEYTQAVNSKIASEGCVIPIKSWKTTTRYLQGSSDKMIITNKVKSLCRMMVVPQLHSVMRSGGLGMDTYPSRFYNPMYISDTATTGTDITSTMNTDSAAGRPFGFPYMVRSPAHPLAPIELRDFRFLIGSTPVTDHSIDCTNGGAQQAMECVKFFRALTDDMNLGGSRSATAAGTSTLFVPSFKDEYGLICQNFSLEQIEDDNVFVGQFANNFSDLTLELAYIGGTIADTDKIHLTFFLEHNALLTVTPTQIAIES